jgi:hypothetical protein
MLNRNLDLWDYDTLVQHADEVEARVGDAKDMPTARTGGPWPDEWIELFRRWRATNFKRLVMGTAEYTFRETGTSPQRHRPGKRHLSSCGIQRLAPDRGGDAHGKDLCALL